MNRQTLEDMAILSALLIIIFLFIGILADEPIAIVIAAVFGLISLAATWGILYNELKE